MNDSQWNEVSKLLPFMSKAQVEHILEAYHKVVPETALTVTLEEAKEIKKRYHVPTSRMSCWEIELQEAINTVLARRPSAPEQVDLAVEALKRSVEDGSIDILSDAGLAQIVAKVDEIRKGEAHNE